MLTAVMSSGERVIRYEAAWRQLTPESCEALGEGGVGPSGDNGYTSRRLTGQLRSTASLHTVGAVNTGTTRRGSRRPTFAALRRRLAATRTTPPPPSPSRSRTAAPTARTARCATTRRRRRAARSWPPRSAAWPSRGRAARLAYSQGGERGEEPPRTLPLCRNCLRVDAHGGGASDPFGPTHGRTPPRRPPSPSPPTGPPSPPPPAKHRQSRSGVRGGDGGGQILKPSLPRPTSPRLASSRGSATAPQTASTSQCSTGSCSRRAAAEEASGSPTCRKGNRSGSKGIEGNRI